ncbi:MAG TPA: flavodoxin domain-containing protein [Mycobacteriales bacterium]|nr:flavodoxin domain-containing protein [Mycobacteriales bacterium]
MKVLVAYGSTRGGTAGLAHMVADAFAMRGVSTEVRRAGDIRDLDDVDAVVVGGALYSNRWHPDAVAFVGRHRSELQQLPVWFFSSGPLDDSARSGALAAVPQVSALAREIEIRGHMTFGGLLDKRPTGLLAMFSYGAEGDFRDAAHVAEWVERIATDLLNGRAPTIRVINDAPYPSQAPKPPDPQPAPAAEIKPHKAKPRAEVEEVVAATDGEVQVDWGPELEWPQQPVARKRSRLDLRRYLTLEVDEDSDDGLELFEEVGGGPNGFPP